MNHSTFWFRKGGIMHFNAKRYLYGLSKRRIWLLLILLPPLIYLLISAVHSDRFSVKQKISITKDSPVALASNAMSVKPMGEIVSRPDVFFQNTFAVRQLYTNLYAGSAVYRADRQFRMLLDTIRTSISLTMPAEGIAQITYYGKDEKIGRSLVGYYSLRLIRKTEEGLALSKIRGPKSQVPVLMGGMEIDEHRAFWRPERSLSFVMICIFSLITVLAFLGFLEWTDPSFKSERQVARYVGLPIIGSLPNLNRIYAALNVKRSS